MSIQADIKRIIELDELYIETLLEGESEFTKLSKKDAKKICGEIRQEIHDINEKLGTYTKH